MQRAEIDQEQKLFTQQVSEIKGEIKKLVARREVLEKAQQRYSPLLQKIGKFIRLGAAGKLEWTCLKLKYKQGQLARLVLHPDERMNGVTTLLGMVPAAKAVTTRILIQPKSETI